MSQESEEQLLRSRTQLNRHLYQQKITNAAEALAEQQQPTIYQGYNKGLGRLENFSGSASYGSAITNGAIALGDNMRMRGNKYDSVPRIQKESQPSQPINKTGKVFFFYGAAKTTNDSSSILGAFVSYYIYFDSSNSLIKDIKNEILRINIPPDVDALLTFTSVPTENIRLNVSTDLTVLGLSFDDFFYTEPYKITKNVGKTTLSLKELASILGITAPMSSSPRGYVDGTPYFISSRPGSSLISETALLEMTFKYKKLVWNGAKWIIQ